jgi:hypothetical protein
MAKDKVAQRKRREERLAPTRSGRSSGGGGRRFSPVAIAIGGVVGVLVVVVAFVIFYELRGQGSGGNGKRSAVPPSVLHAITTIPTSEFDQIGAKAVTAFPYTVKSPTPVKVGGKPLLLYMGAEYCPYCAAERWGMVAALSRFGTFSNLGATHSSSVDVYKNTATFSFYKSTYTSPYITFQAVETYTNKVLGNFYAPLQTPTKAQAHLNAVFDAPPYVPAAVAGSIPFIFFGGYYVQAGASYVPQVLQGLSMTQIGAELHTPIDAPTQAIVSTANVISAGICKMTGDRPSTVCSTAGVKAAAAKIAAAAK